MARRKRQTIGSVRPFTLRRVLDRLHIGLTEDLRAHDVCASHCKPLLLCDPAAGIQTHADERLNRECAVGVARLHRIVETDVGFEFASQVVVPDVSDESGTSTDTKDSSRVPGNEMPQIAWHLPKHWSNRGRTRSSGLRRAGNRSEDERQKRGDTR